MSGLFLAFFTLLTLFWSIDLIVSMEPARRILFSDIFWSSFPRGWSSPFGCWTKTWELVWVWYPGLLRTSCCTSTAKSSTSISSHSSYLSWYAFWLDFLISIWFLCDGSAPPTVLKKLTWIGMFSPALLFLLLADVGSIYACLVSPFISSNESSWKLTMWSMAET